MKRLFFALWPDADVRSQLAGVAESLPDKSGRRIQPENLHITLVFLGNVQERIIPELTDGANQLKMPGFSLQINRSGWWKRPKVIWLAPEYTPPPLLRLVEQINQLSKRAGLSIEQRNYQPHLTIARKVNHPADNLRFDPIHWRVKDFCLIESVTCQRGASYQVRQSWPLSHAPSVRNERGQERKGSGL